MMTHKMTLYQTPQLAEWQGRKDAQPDEYFYQWVQALDLNHLSSDIKPGAALLGFACDIGVRRNLGRPGAKAGPPAIKQALARLPLQNNITLYDAGSIVAEGDDLETAQTQLACATALLLEKNIFPIILGGGHETAWGHYQGLEKHFGTQPLSIVNFDAHFDLRDIPANFPGTSGTPFRQIANARAAQHLPFDYTCIGIQENGNTRHLFEVAKELKVHYLLASEMFLKDKKYSTDFLAPILNQAEKIYLSICLDVFAAEYAPGVSAPQVLGVTPWQVIPLLEQILASKKVCSIDIVELAPCFDIDQRTSKLAANLLSKILATLQLLP